jgi:hypothetical protein
MKAETRTLECGSFGVGFRLAARSDELLAKMRLCVPLGTEVGACVHAAAVKEFAVFQNGPRASYRLRIEDEVVGESAELHDILELLKRDLMVHVADRAPDRVFVHAGVAGWKGRAVVMPGMSFAGKTTLVAEMVRAGATYYSDEYAVIDACGRVHPYARELQMRAADCVEQRGVSVAELGGVAANEPALVSHVVFAEYAEGARWAPVAISRGSAVLEMMQHAIAVRRAPGRVMTTLTKMMETAEAMRGVRGEASEMARWLLDEVSA